MTDSELVEAVNKFISSYHKKIDKKDLLEAIKTIYSNKKISKKNNDVDKPKRAPTEYNLFMSSEMEKLKKEDSKLNGKEKMELIANKWKEHKGTKKPNEEEIKVFSIELKKSNPTAATVMVTSEDFKII
jgi:hypothetical protein